MPARDPLTPGAWRDLTEDQVDDLVDEWHDGAFKEGTSLQEALGQTDDEHSSWVVTGKAGDSCPS